MVKPTPAVQSNTQRTTRRRRYSVVDEPKLKNNQSPPEVITLKWNRFADPDNVFDSSIAEMPKFSEEDEPIQMILPAPEPLALRWYEPNSDDSKSENSEQNTPETINQDKQIVANELNNKITSMDKPNDLKNNAGAKSNIMEVGYRRGRRVPAVSGQYRSANTSQTRNGARMKPGAKPTAKDIKRTPFINKRWSY